MSEEVEEEKERFFLPGRGEDVFDKSAFPKV
jgi:hypothetical protein